ncbi:MULTISPECIES: M1 family metallopeptidase [unclassified Stenotrophomonas]|uniref:M1 family metallopeptidase n=1 Tax=Stenotrophomonas TaxID=40323 RepID=UPI000EDBFFD3|nr:M1 family metallopeptidase [Stenotrophomonas sp. SORGH_AS_0282]MDQ1061416.1 leukotriene-A4 hydrolase [Stenotrophomonas sp. SORGH_AS_0282]MDQ1190234.1 leukotriene-A4 hydrolase [Stenotrophomonas sp. SORGH_AS_0282]HBZ47960.1 aminopeptidase [Stenotrophomonas sp.]
MRSPFLLIPLAVALAAGCSKEPAAPTAAPAAQPSADTAVKAVNRSHDESSYAEPDKVVIKDLGLDLKLDFDSRQIGGTATYTLEWKDKAAKQLVLDTRELTIEKVEAVAADGSAAPLQFALAPADKVFGSKLTIEAPAQPGKVRVTYHTAPTASGLQWLEPSMTEGKQLPFMFSQSQAIHARSWVPLQDTPSVRFTYSAHVASRPDVMVLMSADNDPKAARDGDYTFKMPQPIPSYLLAIAAGDLVFEPISGRSGVWAEPTMVGKAAKEFEDTEKMIGAAEKLYGEYRWGRYDMLVLPPSFPFGGMENPRLTFATPTVIVGDKSLVSLVAHELAHSWSGNLVTNSSWKDIWLNEGFTTYVQGRITEALYGQEMAEMEREIDQNDLLAEVKDMSPADQALALPPLTERDPDEALSNVAYVKGSWFLQFLEQRFGREVFDPFLRGWFDDHAFQSANTDQFVEYLKKNLLSKKPGAVTDAELKAWLDEPGIPAFATKARSRNFSIVDTARIAWQGSGTLPSAQITSEWGTQEWVHFIDGMGKTLPVDKLAALDKAYTFTGTANGEIAMRWYPLAIRSGYLEANEAAGAFIERVGRRKLILPIYAELVKTPEGLAFAKAAFEKAKPSYHPITTASVQDMLDKASAGK